MSYSPLVLAVCLAAGVAAGVAYFLSLWWSARRLANGERARVAILWTFARLFVIGGVLALTAIEGGALALLLAALGVFAGRALVLRGLRASAR
jgi:F1F0 ATPase subunit 2